MQKKNRLPDTSSSSAWQENVKKQQNQQNMKRYGIWAVIIVACVLGLGALVMLAGKTSPTATPVATPNLPGVRKNDIILGDPKAKVTITEYGDLQCPACAEYNPVVNQVLSDYKGKVRVIFRFFPLVQVHQNALIGAQASYAAFKQGKFAEMKDILFDKQDDWGTLPDPRPTFISYAKGLGMNTNKFSTDMNSTEAKNRVLDSEKEALNLGLNSTPSFFIGNKYFQPQGYPDFKTLIDEELSKK